MVRIFSKKTFGLGPGATKDGRVDLLRTVVNGFMDIDEKYTQCKIFELAVKAGDITIIDDKSKQEEIAREAIKKEVKEVEIDEKELFKNEVKAMNKSEAIQKANELGVVLTGDEKVAEIKRKIIAASEME